MASKPGPKPAKVRPMILVDSVEAAKRIVVKKYGENLANSLGDGDLIDLAFKILSEEEEL